MALGLFGGVVIGLLMGMMGGGGAILAIPLFVYGLHLDHSHSIVASLVVVAVGAVFGGVTHSRQGNVAVLRGLAFAAIGAIGSAAATYIAQRVRSEHFMVYFAALLVLVAAVMLRRVWKVRRISSADATLHPPAPSGGTRWLPERPVVFVVAAIVVGFLTGFFGVGGGFLIVPALTLALAMPMRRAVGTSLLVIFINTIVALALRGGQVWDLDVPTVAPVLLTVVIGVLAGSRISHKVPERALRTGFALFLLSIAGYVMVSST